MSHTLPIPGTLVREEIGGKVFSYGETSPLRKEFRKGDSINDVYRILSQYVLK